MQEGKAIQITSTNRSPSFAYPFTTHRIGQSLKTHFFLIQGSIPPPSSLALNQKALRDFPEADHFFGAKNRFPCRVGSKIVILKGRYTGQNAVTLTKKFRPQRSGYGAWEHRVIVADSSIFWVKQRDICLLDPYHKFVTGTPLQIQDNTKSATRTRTSKIY